jgi:hypothetical protein
MPVKEINHKGHEGKKLKKLSNNKFVFFVWFVVNLLHISSWLSLFIPVKEINHKGHEGKKLKKLSNNKFVFFVWFVVFVWADRRSDVVNLLHIFFMVIPLHVSSWLSFVSFVVSPLLRISSWLWQEDQRAGSEGAIRRIAPMGVMRDIDPWLY